MDYEDVDVNMYKNNGGNLVAKVYFPEESDSGLKIDTDFVTRRVVEEGFEFTRFLNVETVVDKEGERVEAEWVFELPGKEPEIDYMSVKGIGRKKSEKLKEFADPVKILENIESVSEELTLSKSSKKKLKSFLQDKIE